LRSILIVEGHDSSRIWWEEHIREVFPDIEVFGAATCAEARSLLDEGHQFTLAILDINLPDGSGIDLLTMISLKSPDTYALICSIYDDDTHIFSALRAGAKGYLLKDQPREKQLRQLKEIVHGQPPLSPGVARRILAHFAEEKVTETKTRTTTCLSVRESEVLQLIAKGYSRPEVAEMLQITRNTVSGYTKAIYQKLNISSRAEAVTQAIKLGLISQDTE